MRRGATVVTPVARHLLAHRIELFVDPVDQRRGKGVRLELDDHLKAERIDHSATKVESLDALGA